MHNESHTASPEDISCALDLNVQTVIQVLNTDHSETSQQDTIEAFLHEVRTFIYSYTRNTDQLHRTSLVTGEHSSHRVPSYTFKEGCNWSEVPGGSSYC
jgi:hypothetical protein